MLPLSTKPKSKLCPVTMTDYGAFLLPESFLKKNAVISTYTLYLFSYKRQACHLYFWSAFLFAKFIEESEKVSFLEDH